MWEFDRFLILTICFFSFSLLTAGFTHTFLMLFLVVCVKWGFVLYNSRPYTNAESYLNGIALGKKDCDFNMILCVAILQSGIDRDVHHSRETCIVWDPAVNP